MKRLIPKDLLAGQRSQVLDSYQATDDLRQALNYPDELSGFDDLLSAIGANRSNYMQSANQQKLLQHSEQWRLGHREAARQFR